MIATTLTDHQSGEWAKLDAHADLEARREIYINRGRRALLLRHEINAKDARRLGVARG